MQCGFCTPGILTTAHALLTEEPDADADRIREVLSGNLCRCTGYVSIIDAVLDARRCLPEGRRMNVVPNTLIGQEIERTEDLRFLTGTGTFVDDYEPAGHACTQRSCAARSRMAALSD